MFVLNVDMSLIKIISQFTLIVLNVILLMIRDGAIALLRKAIALPRSSLRGFIVFPLRPSGEPYPPAFGSES